MMDKKTREALEASIEKWKRNTRVRTQENFLTSPYDCPLCELFYRGEDCPGCPVSAKTGVGNCDLTPYEKAYFKSENWHEDNGKAARAAAKEEVAFLKSLRP